MSASTRATLLGLMIVATMALSACEDDKTKAERYFSSANQLLEQGDIDRALIELRNVFKYDGMHKEARELYADLLIRQGNVNDAYRQYLRLAEQFPDDLEVRLRLADLAVEMGRWEEIERNGEVAIRLGPDDPRAQAVAMAVSYGKAARDGERVEMERIATEARQMLQGMPGNMMLSRIVVDWLANGDDPRSALPYLDAALEKTPDSLVLNMQKFRVLTISGDEAGTGEQLKRMVQLFPDNLDIRQAMIAWYIVSRDLEGAEAYLRELAGADDSAPDGHISVVQFLQTTQSIDVARAELERLLAANAGNPNADLYAAILATMDFEDGDRNQAIAKMRALIESAEPSDQTRRVELMLAKMLVAQGDRGGAETLIEKVIAADPGQAEALKMRAGWRIQDDRVGDAIIDLRTALNTNPRDVSTLNMMATAYEREGSMDLAADRLAAAVDVSNAAPPESVRYALFLLGQGRVQPAETVLSNSLRSNPGNLQVLTALGGLYASQGDSSRAEAVVKQLIDSNDPNGQQAGRTIQASLLARQGRAEESVELLREQAHRPEAAPADVFRLVTALAQLNQNDQAEIELKAGLERFPTEVSLKIIDAGLMESRGDVAGAEALYRNLMQTTPQNPQPALGLYALLMRAGQPEAADAIIDEALTGAPQSPELRMIKAAQLERAGDEEGALAIFESLYAEDSSNLIYANNLASLLSSLREDSASIERAGRIAQRLKDLPQPAFQDTYGWAMYRQGKLTEALPALESAALGLPTDPNVQLHLGLTYAALGRTDDAIATLQRGLELAGDRELPQGAVARAKIAELQKPAAGTTPANP